MTVGPYYSTIRREKDLLAGGFRQTEPTSLKRPAVWVTEPGRLGGYWMDPATGQKLPGGPFDPRYTRINYQPSVTETPHEGGTLVDARMVPSDSRSSDGVSKFLQKLISDFEGIKQQPATVIVQQDDSVPTQQQANQWDMSAILKGALIGIAVVMVLRMIR